MGALGNRQWVLDLNSAVQLQRPHSPSCHLEQERGCHSGSVEQGCAPSLRPSHSSRFSTDAIDTMQDTKQEQLMTTYILFRRG